MAAGATPAIIGNDDHTATALYAGLILKEAAKVPAEGYSTGSFRHGPMELAGPGLVAVMLGTGSNDSARRLADDLITAGSVVIDVDAQFDTRPGTSLGRLAVGAVVTQHLAVAIGRARGIEPGAFTHASKITSVL